MQPWALVTPASRGIGLALARRLLETTNVPVVATARKDLDQTRENLLTGLEDVKEDRLNVLRVDLLDESTLSAAAEDIQSLFPPKTSYLHLALCIPGMLHAEKSPAQIDADAALLTFRTNVIGPMLALKHLGPFLPRKSTELASDLSGPLNPSAAIWAAMSARVGSITDNRGGGWYSYRASKAAVNQVVKSHDLFLAANSGEKAFSVALHPGTVKTGLSEAFWQSVKEEKLFSPEFAAEKLLDVLGNLKIEQRGKCWDWKGEEIAP